MADRVSRARRPKYAATVGPWIKLRHRELVDERLEGATDDIHFPIRLAARVIAQFSSAGDLVLDPFAGYGTTGVAATRMGRRSIAIELLAERANVIRERLGDLGRVVSGDARNLRDLVSEPVDLCFTSPPYMTATDHPENPLTGYETLDGDYATYLDDLESVGQQVAALLRPGAHLVVNAATITRTPEPTRLADDVADRLSRHLIRRADLAIEWDIPPAGIIDDRCLVFEKPPGRTDPELRS
jgi:DNA modification methylase